MSAQFVSRGFKGKRHPHKSKIVFRPGQHEVTDFPCCPLDPLHKLVKEEMK
jgi:hypothetical protein